MIVNSASMQVQAVVRKAHLGIVTTMRFSQDSRFSPTCLSPQTENLSFLRIIVNS